MDLVATLAETIEQLGAARSRVLVAIDGPDAAGKTTLADRIASHVGDSVIRASIDHFENPIDVRIRDGRGGDTYYRDGFDHATFRAVLLEPFAAGASQVVTQWRDPHTDERRELIADVPARAVLVADGVFLQRPELRHHWTYVVYLTVEPSVSLARAQLRDIQWHDSVAAINEGYAVRYLPGQAIYRDSVDPVSLADLVVDNTSPTLPVILRTA